MRVSIVLFIGALFAVPAMADTTHGSLTPAGIHARLETIRPLVKRQDATALQELDRVSREIAGSTLTGRGLLVDRVNAVALSVRQGTRADAVSLLDSVISSLRPVAQPTSSTMLKNDQYQHGYNHGYNQGRHGGQHGHYHNNYHSGNHQYDHGYHAGYDAGYFSHHHGH